MDSKLDTNPREGPRKRGFTLWFTGLFGSGKSTLAKPIASILSGQGRNVEILDGDEVRQNLSKGLGSSKADRDTNIKRIGYVAKLLTRNGVVTITAAISPHRDARGWCRKQIGRFVEVYVNCPLGVCEGRDTKEGTSYSSPRQSGESLATNL